VSRPGATLLALGAAGALAAAATLSGRRRGARNWQHWDRPLGAPQLAFTFGWGLNETLGQFWLADRESWRTARRGAMHDLPIWSSLPVTLEVMADERVQVGREPLAPYVVLWEPVAIAATTTFPSGYEAMLAEARLHKESVRRWAVLNAPPRRPDGHDGRLPGHHLTHIRNWDPRRPIHWDERIEFSDDLSLIQEIDIEAAMGLNPWLITPTVSTVVMRVIDIFDPYSIPEVHLDTLARMSHRTPDAELFKRKRLLGGRSTWAVAGQRVPPRIAEILDQPKGS
jgi:hypothetical protein